MEVGRPVAVRGRRTDPGDRLARLNGLRNPNRLRIGQRLRIAGAATTSSTAVRASSGSGYRVRPGDTLAGIAARLGTSPSALAARNGIRHPNRLRIGPPGVGGQTIASVIGKVKLRPAK